MIKILNSAIVFALTTKLFEAQHQGQLAPNFFMGIMVVLGLLYVYIDGGFSEKELFISERDFVANVIIATIISARMGDIVLTPEEISVILIITYIYFFKYAIVFMEEITSKMANFINSSQ